MKVAQTCTSGVTTHGPRGTVRSCRGLRLRTDICPGTLVSTGPTPPVFPELNTSAAAKEKQPKPQLKKAKKNKPGKKQQKQK